MYSWTSVIFHTKKRQEENYFCLLTLPTAESSKHQLLSEWRNINIRKKKTEKDGSGATIKQADGAGNKSQTTSCSRKHFYAFCLIIPILGNIELYKSQFAPELNKLMSWLRFYIRNTNLNHLRLFSYWEKKGLQSLLLVFLEKQKYFVPNGVSLGQP